MPWKDKAKIRAYQRRWHAKKKQDKEWHEKVNARKKARNHAVRATAARLIERFRQNDHNHRMREWEHQHKNRAEKNLISAGLGIVFSRKDMNPFFTVIDKDGNKRHEELFEPFPTW